MNAKYVPQVSRTLYDSKDEKHQKEFTSFLSTGINSFDIIVRKTHTAPKSNNTRLRFPFIAEDKSGKCARVLNTPILILYVIALTVGNSVSKTEITPFCGDSIYI